MLGACACAGCQMLITSALFATCWKVIWQGNVCTLRSLKDRINHQMSLRSTQRKTGFFVFISFFTWMFCLALGPCSVLLPHQVQKRASQTRKWGSLSNMKVQSPTSFNALYDAMQFVQCSPVRHPCLHLLHCIFSINATVLHGSITAAPQCLLEEVVLHYTIIQYSIPLRSLPLRTPRLYANCSTWFEHI